MRGSSDDVEHQKHSTGPQELENQIDKDVKKADLTNPEAKDPDLVFSVRGVLQAGKKLNALLAAGQFCNKGAAWEDDEDDDPIESDLSKDPEKEWVSDEKEDQATDEAEEEDEPGPAVTTVNDTALMDLLNWETDMKSAVTDFETKVHPHGYKWWRYREPQIVHQYSEYSEHGEIYKT